MLEPLTESIRARRAMLFVGAGVSRNLGLPSFKELIREMARLLDFNADLFERQGDYRELAEYYNLQKKSLGGLRSWMDRSWHKDESQVDKSPVHRAIVDLKFPPIYTTNYDRWLEIAFERRNELFTKIANVGDFTNIRDGITQIIKLHGDLEDDNSLVLTETSYFRRLDFESPLDIKLRSDIIGRVILFIGYRLSDINIRYLLYKLHRLWEESQFASARPKAYIFLSRPNPVQEAILENRGIIPVVPKIDDEAVGLREFLENLVREAFGRRVGSS